MSLKLYKSYSFQTKDPVIDQMRTLVDNAHASYTQISNASGVSTSTLSAWFHGKTRRPQSASVEAVGRSLGYRREWKRFKKISFNGKG